MVAHLQLNREEDARRAFVRYKELHPLTTVEGVRTGQPFDSLERLQPLIDTLGELGMPEH